MISLLEGRTVTRKGELAGRAAGEAAVREANEARWRDRVTIDFDKFQKERLATAELELQRLINDATTRLSQVPHHPLPGHPARRGCLRENMRVFV